MISSSEMLSQIFGAVTPGLEGVQADMITLMAFFISIGVIMVGFIVVVSIMRGRLGKSGGYISGGGPFAGSSRWHYGGSRQRGLISSRRYE